MRLLHGQPLWLITALTCLVVACGSNDGDTGSQGADNSTKEGGTADAHPDTATTRDGARQDGASTNDASTNDDTGIKSDVSVAETGGDGPPGNPVDGGGADTTADAADALAESSNPTPDASDDSAGDDATASDTGVADAGNTDADAGDAPSNCAKPGNALSCTYSKRRGATMTRRDRAHPSMRGARASTTRRVPRSSTRSCLPLPAPIQSP